MQFIKNNFMMESIYLNFICQQNSIELKTFFNRYGLRVFFQLYCSALQITASSTFSYVAPLIPSIKVAARVVYSLSFIRQTFG